MSAKLAMRRIKRWRDEPIAFATEELKIQELDPWQLEALRVFPSQDPDKMRISLQACVGPGKSMILAVCGWNFLSCYGDAGEHPKGAAVSITAQNLADNLWAEYSKWQERSEYLKRAFVWTKKRIYALDHPETWFMSARSFSKTANTEELGRTLSGLHSKYVLAQIDESGDIPPAVGKAAEQALSNCKWGKIQQAGNPTSLEGILHTAATTQRHLWYVIRITGDPDDPNRSPRIDIDWAREQIATEGRDNPWVMSSILGLFPPSSINSLLGPNEVEAAMRMTYPEDTIATVQKRLGVDCARFGDDRTVIFPRQGLVAYKPTVMKGARSGGIAARVGLAKERWRSEREYVDGTGGYGAGTVDGLIQAGYSPVEVNFAGQADDSRYFNKRAEIWFRMAEWIRRGGAIPKDPQLVRELTAPTYTFQGGKFRLEEKAQIKKRLKFSPDMGDALALTFTEPEMPAAHARHGKERGGLLSEYDPFSSDRL